MVLRSHENNSSSYCCPVTITHYILRQDLSCIKHSTPTTCQEDIHYALRVPCSGTAVYPTTKSAVMGSFQLSVVLLEIALATESLIVQHGITQLGYFSYRAPRGSHRYLLNQYHNLTFPLPSPASMVMEPYNDLHILLGWSDS